MTSLENYIEQNQCNVDYQTELAAIDLNEKIIAKMNELKINRVGLANRLGVSKAFVTKLLNGNPNMTLKTIVSIAIALDCQLYQDIYSRGFKMARKPLYIHTNKGYEAYTPITNEVADASAA